MRTWPSCDALCDRDLIEPSAPPAPIFAAGDRPVRASPSACRRTFATPACCAMQRRPIRCRASGGLRAVVSGSCSHRDPGAGRRRCGEQYPGIPRRSHAILRRGRDVVGEALAWARRAASARAACSSTLRDTAGVGQGGAGRSSGRRRPAIWWNEALAAVAQRAGGDGRRPADRRRRRNLRSGRQGARRHRLAHRPRNRSRRALDCGAGRRGSAGAGAQVRQLRRARFLPQGMGSCQTAA